ncbi:MAG: MFS transporter [Albidovulum sp.]
MRSSPKLMQILDQWKTGLFAAMLAAAGLPIYIHLPQFATSELGLSLATIGTILIGIRFLDFLQDPFLGWMVDRWPRFRRHFAAVAVFGLGLGFLLLFSVAPLFRAELWLISTLVILFTAYSLATILIYGQSVEIAESGGAAGHYKIASYREAGLIIGVVIAAIGPAILALIAGPQASYRLFGWLLGAFALIVWALTRSLWATQRLPTQPLTMAALKHSGGIYLLCLALANALPVALTSTLFLFFVEDRLALPGFGGIFLILFFLSAGVCAPLWSWAVRRYGPKKILLPAMALSIAGFIGAAALPAGGALEFALICLVSGAALGADIVILPALFSTVLSASGLPAGQAFGIWALVSKLALALAAITALPYLESAGYTPGGANTAEALSALNFTYAVLPCLMKLVAVAMVLRLPSKLVST